MFDLRKILFVVLLIVMFAFWTDGISLLGNYKINSIYLLFTIK